MTIRTQTQELLLRDAVARMTGFAYGSSTPDLDKGQWDTLRGFIIEVAEQAAVYFDSPALAWNPTLTPIKDAS